MTIVLGSIKGGSGKTTIATNLAVMRAIRHHVSLDDAALLLMRQLMEDWIQLTMNLPKPLVTTAFGNKDDMILAIPT